MGLALLLVFLFLNGPLHFNIVIDILRGYLAVFSELIHWLVLALEFEGLLKFDFLAALTPVVVLLTVASSVSASQRFVVLATLFLCGV